MNQYQNIVLFNVNNIRGIRLSCTMLMCVTFTVSKRPLSHEVESAQHLIILDYHACHNAFMNIMKYNQHC